MPGLELPPNWPPPTSFESLVDMAVPLFIFASTACRFISDSSCGDPGEQLDRILEYQKKGGWSQLHTTYLPILNQLFLKRMDSGPVSRTKDEKAEILTWFREIVGTIVVLADPLSTISLARVLGRPPLNIGSKLRGLHSILHISEDPHAPIKLLHLSFRDFLVNDKNRDANPFWIDEREVHERLAVRCLQLLSTDNNLKRDICDLQRPSIRRSEIDQQTIDVALPPEIQYACRYWVYHWKESKCRIRDGDLVDNFLTNHLLHWLEALGLLERISESIGMVDDLLASLDLEESTSISAFLRDTRRIILSHGSIIDISPSQVYNSVIVFAPEQSVVRKMFRKEFPAWLPLLPQVDPNWDACLKILEGHDSGVYSVALSQDAKMVASVSGDTVKLWDVATSTCITTLEDDGVWSVAFSPDAKILASSGNTVKLWDVVTSVCIATLEGHNDSISSIIFSQDTKMLASASKDSTIKLWDVVTGVCITTFEGHNDRVLSVAFSSDAKILASGSISTIKLWDVVTSVCITTFEDYGQIVWSVAFSYDTKILASTSGKKVRLWDIAKSACMTTFEGHSDKVASVAFSHDAKVLISISRHMIVKLWDIAMGTCTTIFEGYSDPIESVAFSQDAKILVSGSEDRTIKFWDMTANAYTTTFERHRERVNSIIFSQDTKILASASRDSTIKLWDVVTGVCITTFEGHNDTVWSVAFSHDAKILASGSTDIIKLWDIDTGAGMATLEGHSGWVVSVAFSYDAKILVSASRDKTIKLWDVGTGVCTATFEEQSLCFSSIGDTRVSTASASVAFSHNAKILASTSDNRTVKIRDVTTGTCTAIFEGYSDSVESVAFSHDADFFVWVASVAFSHDSKMLASASDDHSVKIWDVATGACTSTLGRHSEFVTSVAFSYDMKMLVSASNDDTIKFWDVATGACLGTIDAGTRHLAFDAAGLLYTDVGIFTINDPSQSSPLSSTSALDPPPRTINRQGIGLSKDRVWITWDSNEVLWLPPAYRSSGSVVTASTMGIGCSSGRVILLAISPDRGLLI